jgi:hypothetical protein
MVEHLHRVLWFFRRRFSRWLGSLPYQRPKELVTLRKMLQYSKQKQLLKAIMLFVCTSINEVGLYQVILLSRQ